jgi:hypothetical protein
VSFPVPLRRLLRPTEAFAADGSADFRAAFLLVLVVAVATAASVGVAAGTVAGSVDGVVTVDNPEHRSGPVCDPDTFDGASFDVETPAGCDAPPTVDRRLSGYAREAAAGLTLPAGAGVVVGWLLAGAWLHAVRGPDGSSVLDALGDAGWAVVPLALPAALRPVVLAVTADAVTYGGTVESVRSTARTVATGVPGGPLFVLSAAALCWGGVVLYGALRAGDRVPPTGAAAAVAVPLVALLGAAWLGPPADGEGAVFGAVLVVFGLPNALAPRLLIRLEKIDDLIGMRGSIEPKDWYVSLHRHGGLLAAAVGFLVAGAPAVLV